MLCLQSCGRLWSVCVVVLVPYVDAVVVVSMMRVLLFVLHVCMLRECEGDGNAVVGMEEVWLCLMQGMWVVHVVQVLCIA